MIEFRNKFHTGQVVHHALFDYHGVVVDVDQTFQLSEEWYEEVARSRPPKDQPWYHILVHGTHQTTYVAERNLEPGPVGNASSIRCSATSSTNSAMASTATPGKRTKTLSSGA